MELTVPVLTVIVLAIISGFWTIGRVLMMLAFKQLDLRFVTQNIILEQSEKKLEERFSKQIQAQERTEQHWESRYSKLEQLAQSNEKDLLLMRGDLPNLYVRREDYIRGQTIIESKLDALYSKLEVVQLQGVKKHD
jgi:hypothetical protein